MSFFAAAAVDRVKQIPADFWVKLGLAVGGLVLAVILLRKLAKMNKVVLGILVLLVVSFVFFSWIYERNEPAWATPFIQQLAEFFPSKGRR